MDQKTSASLRIDADIPVKANGEVVVHDSHRGIFLTLLIVILMIVITNFVFSLIKYSVDKVQNERIEKLENAPAK